MECWMVRNLARVHVGASNQSTWGRVRKGSRPLITAKRCVYVNIHTERFFSIACSDLNNMNWRHGSVWWAVTNLSTVRNKLKQSFCLSPVDCIFNWVWRENPWNFMNQCLVLSWYICHHALLGTHPHSCWSQQSWPCDLQGGDAICGGLVPLLQLWQRGAQQQPACRHLIWSYFVQARGDTATGSFPGLFALNL